MNIYYVYSIRFNFTKFELNIFDKFKRIFSQDSSNDLYHTIFNEKMKTFSNGILFCKHEKMKLGFQSKLKLQQKHI